MVRRLFATTQEVTNMPNASDLKRGTRFLYEGSPFQVTDMSTQSPSARGAATLVKVKARDLLTGQLKSYSFKASERFDDPDIELRKVQYLYRDDDAFHFMDLETYDQYRLVPDNVGEAEDYLLEELEVRLMFFNELPVSVELPKAMDMEIVQCDPGLKGDTVTNVTKAANLATGLVVQVPLFINQGDVIRVDTSEGRYVERVSVAKR
jgi:elongation factor P